MHGRSRGTNLRDNTWRGSLPTVPLLGLPFCPVACSQVLYAHPRTKIVKATLLQEARTLRLLVRRALPRGITVFRGVRLCAGRER